MPKNQDVWYRVGYALESTRRGIPAARGGSHRKPAPAREVPARVLEGVARRVLADLPPEVMETIFTVGAGTVLTRVLSLWPGRGRPGLFRLLRAGASGAAAALLAELIRPVLTGKKTGKALEEELTDILLSGAGRGLLYAALVEPRIPGPPALQGSVYGALEYALTPWGGLEDLAGSAVPYRRIPGLSVLLRGRGEEEALLEHLAFGVALAILYRK
jgi:hypothetical protein